MKVQSSEARSFSSVCVLIAVTFFPIQANSGFGAEESHVVVPGAHRPLQLAQDGGGDSETTPTILDVCGIDEVVFPDWEIGTELPGEPLFEQPDVDNWPPSRQVDESGSVTMPPGTIVLDSLPVEDSDGTVQSWVVLTTESEPPRADCQNAWLAGLQDWEEISFVVGVVQTSGEFERVDGLRCYNCWDDYDCPRRPDLTDICDRPPRATVTSLDEDLVLICAPEGCGREYHSGSECYIVSTVTNDMVDSFYSRVDSPGVTRFQRRLWEQETVSLTVTQRSVSARTRRLLQLEEGVGQDQLMATAGEWTDDGEFSPLSLESQPLWRELVALAGQLTGTPGVDQSGLLALADHRLSVLASTFDEDEELPTQFQCVRDQVKLRMFERILSTWGPIETVVYFEDRLPDLYPALITSVSVIHKDWPLPDVHLTSRVEWSADGNQLTAIGPFQYDVLSVEGIEQRTPQFTQTHLMNPSGNRVFSWLVPHDDSVTIIVSQPNLSEEERPYEWDYLERVFRAFRDDSPSASLAAWNAMDERPVPNEILHDPDDRSPIRPVRCWEDECPAAYAVSFADLPIENHLIQGYSEDLIEYSCASGFVGWLSDEDILYAVASQFFRLSMDDGSAAPMAVEDIPEHLLTLAGVPYDRSVRYFISASHLGYGVWRADLQTGEIVHVGGWDEELDDNIAIDEYDLDEELVFFGTFVAPSPQGDHIAVIAAGEFVGVWDIDSDEE